MGSPNKRFSNIIALKVWFDGHAEWGQTLVMEDDGAIVQLADGHTEGIDWYNVLDELENE